MDYGYDIYFSSYFEKQWDTYGEHTQRFVEDKIKLIKANPFRFKPHKGYKNVFKVKLSIKDKYSRLMFAVYLPDDTSISILGIFPRDLDYKDFNRIFSYLRK